MPASPTTRRHLITRRARTLLVTALGLSAVLSVGLWDAHHEDQLALEQLTRQQHRLAEILSRQVALLGRGTSLDAQSWLESEADFIASSSGPDETPHRPHEPQIVVLLGNSAGTQFLGPRGRWLRIPELASAWAMVAPGIILQRDTAAQLGLPRRMAVVGLSPLREASGQFGAIAVAATAEMERDRSQRDLWRSTLGIILASLLVLYAGIGALRTQKRELELERQRALHQMERARDLELGRANRMATIAALSSGIAHEISTPLAVIAGRIEQLLNIGNGEPRAQHALETISNQVGRIDKIIRGFLAFARGDAPLLVKRGANETARRVVDLVEYRYNVQDVKLDFVSTCDDKLQFACEPALFEQALVNVLVNAVEASKPTQHVLFRVDHDQEFVYFRVQDEGVGIPEAAIARVTDPFYTTKSSKGGTGLGLTIAKEIVAHHLGEVTFELRKSSADEPIAGTVVTVQVPRTQEVPIEQAC